MGVKWLDLGQNRWKKYIFGGLRVVCLIIGNSGMFLLSDLGWNSVFKVKMGEKEVFWT